jgi:predicted dehydrogenase
MHIIEFVTGLKVEKVAADLTTFVEGRRLDDDASIMLRLNDNVKGNLSISQIATGEENNLSFSIYGESGAVHWSQENPNYATLSKIGSLNSIITRGGLVTSTSMGNVRIPPGHPEGYLEGFAQIYSDIADVISQSSNSENLLSILPNAEDGMHIMKFINACVASSKNDSEWTEV